VPHPGGGGSAYYALPEGSRGIFVGGGGSVRLPRLIGTARMMDMMLTGRTMTPRKARRSDLALSRSAGDRARQRHRARQHIAGNAPMTNFAVTHVLPRIAAADPPAAMSPRR
jgi:Enoyl-CoA hydratase/carnithine racemase